MFRIALLALPLLLGAGAASAQSNETAAPSAAETGDAVQVGAGTTANTTTGNSGPDQGGEPETAEPIAVDMPFPPPPETALGFPGSLAIEAPDTLRCWIIADPAARQRCDEGGAGLQGGDQ